MEVVSICIVVRWIAKRHLVDYHRGKDHHGDLWDLAITLGDVKKNVVLKIVLRGIYLCHFKEMKVSTDYHVSELQIGHEKVVYFDLVRRHIEVFSRNLLPNCKH